MKKLSFSIEVNASRQKVWDTMLGDKTYREWTSVFAPGSHFVGSWDEGSKILFLDGSTQQGMVSTIVESRPPEFISIKHLGVVTNGVEDTSGPATQGWGDALENYTFREVDGRTEVIVEMDAPEEYSGDFDRMWPEALQKLKVLAE